MSSPFYLGVGTVFSETVTGKLQAAGHRYVSKLLNSTPENWERIVKLLEHEDLVGVLVKFVDSDYARMAAPGYTAVANKMLDRLRQVPHLVLVHEEVAGTAPPVDPEDEVIDGEEYDWRFTKYVFGDVDPAVRRVVHSMFEQHDIEINAYKRNSEAAVLASAFIDDLQDNLLFRMYVPAGRMYEEELARLLTMFHHWLGTVKGANVRQDGYTTANGRVIEFYGDSQTTREHLSTDLAEFNQFLGIIEDRAAAATMLVALGVDATRAEELVTRYARDARRVLLDARHEHDRKMLAIHQQLESELAEEELAISTPELMQVVRRVVPFPALTLDVGSGLALPPGGSPSILVNNQVIQKVEGLVAQHVSGDVHYGTPLDDLLELIRTSDDRNRLQLQDAAKQIADPRAPTSTRITAREQIKSFLVRNAARLEASSYQALWDWAHQQITR